MPAYLQTHNFYKMGTLLCALELQYNAPSLEARDKRLLLLKLRYGHKKSSGKICNQV
jgi:hypothetical protein